MNIDSNLREGMAIMMQMNEDFFSDVTVIIPAYNESSSIRNTLCEIYSYDILKKIKIIVVDDGSKDNTFEEASMVDGVKIIRHKNNKGYGQAIVTATKHVNTPYVAWYDADSQHRPEDLIAIINEIKSKDLDYCVGIRGKDSHVAKSRVLGKFVLGLIINFILHEKTDYNSGLRIFKTEILSKYLSFLPKRFGASTVTTLLMQERNYAGGNVPIVVRQRVGKSSVRQFRDGMNTILLALNIILLFRPMQVFGVVGLALILAGSVYGLIVAFSQGLGVPVLSVIIIFFGLQLLVFGVISHQISQLRCDQLEKTIDK